MGHSQALAPTGGTHGEVCDEPCDWRTTGATGDGGSAVSGGSPLGGPGGPGDPEGNHPEHHCSDVVRDLYLFLDGEITEERRVTIAAHLEECSPCFEAFDFEAELRIVVAARSRAELPEEVRQRVLGVLRDPGLRRDASSS